MTTNNKTNNKLTNIFVTCYENSMQPVINYGDTMALTPQNVDTLINGNIYFFDLGYATVVRRVKAITNEGVTMVRDYDGETQTFNTNKIVSAYKVLGIARMFTGFSNPFVIS